MNIKKILALLLALVLVLSLAACGGDAGNDTQKPDNSGNSADQNGELGFFIHGMHLLYFCSYHIAFLEKRQ